MKMTKRVLSLVLSLVLCFSVCSVAFAASSETECEHVAGRWVTVKEPICTGDTPEMGVQTTTCTLCGEDMTREFGPHSLGEWEITVPATCEQEGHRVQKCTSCLNVINEDTVPSHTYIENTRIEPTCVKDGVSYYVCSGCGRNETVRHYADGESHRMGEWVVTKEATCTDSGEKQRVCLNLGNDRATQCTYVETETIEIDENAHQFLDEWERVEGADPTCEQEGLEVNVCFVCEETVTRAIPKHTDTYVEYDRKEATCSHEGISYVSCTGCGNEAEIAIPCNDAHSYLWEVTQEPTCRIRGFKKGTCVYNKEHTTIEEVEVIPHVAEDEWTIIKESTCTEEGERVKYCKYDNCDEVVERETIKMIPHIASEWIIETGSCAEGGTAVKVCVYPHYDENSNRVNYVMNRTTFLAGVHIGSRTLKVDETCIEDGYTVEWCTICRKELSERNVIPASHKLPDDFTVVEKSTCTKQGYQVKKCENCKYSITDNLPLKAHTYLTVEEAVEATCTEDGTTAHVYCITCYDEKFSEVVYATGHIDENEDGCCDKCYIYYVETDNGIVNCSCMCHNKDGIAKFVFKILVFFYKIMGSNQTCDCGTVHYEGSGLFAGLFG